MSAPAIDWRQQPHLIERPAVIPMSFEEFIAWHHEGGLAEWVDGEARLYVSNSSEHQRILQFLVNLLDRFIRTTGIGEYRTAPYAMRLARRGREPDVTFVLAVNAHRMGPKYLDGPADLTVEIVSDDDPARDREEKFFEYEAAGIREYWVIDSRAGHQRADFYVLGTDASGDGRPMYLAQPVADGVYRSTVLEGFWLRLAWLRDERADPLVCAAEILGPERLIQLLQRPSGG